MLDGKEQIMKCLHCRKPDCDLCGHSRRGAPGASVVLTDADGRERRYETRRAAAMMLGVDPSRISHAIKTGQRVKGFRVRLA